MSAKEAIARLEFNEDVALAVVTLVAIILVALFLLLSSQKEYRFLRGIAIAIAFFVFGLHIGIDLTKRGAFVIPLSVMQKQMHEVFEIPLHRLRPDP